MANTYTLIASNTLGSSAASVTFSSIPGTYTDLVLRYTARGTDATWSRDLYIKYNNDSGTNYSDTLIEAPGPNSSRGSNRTSVVLDSNIVAGTATANTFSTGEIYLPSYTVSQNKPQSYFNAGENNSTTLYRLQAGALLWRNTAAITSIVLSLSSGSFVSGSSFFLYGIKNS